MSTKDFSSIQETTIAKYLNWSTVSGSGATPFHKGDVYSSTWLGECKTRMKSSKTIVVYMSHLTKISNEAMFDRKKSVLFVDDGSQLLPCTWAVFYPQSIFPISNSICCIKVNDQLNINEKTVTFEHSKLRSLYETLIKKFKHVVFVLDWKAKQICLAPISEFKYISEVMQ